MGEIMKFKKNISLIILPFLLLFNSCSKQNNPVTETKETANAKKAWTYLFYDDAVVSNIYDPLNDFSELVASGDNVNFVVLREGINSTGEI
jgi:hypothetical protein